MPTIASLFAGVGGFDLAFTRAGYTVTSAVEIDAAARGVIAERFPETALHNDVTEVTGDQLRADGFVSDGGVLVGGFPCQDLSVAGRRAGLAGSRSGLFWHIDRLLAELRPEWVVLENVPGLLSSNNGRDMGAVLGALAERGYGYAYRVLDAQHFGVPQRRRRVFIVGRLGDHRGPVSVLLEPEGGRRDLAPRDKAGTIVADLTANGAGAGGGVDDNTAQAGHLVPAVAFHMTQDPISGRVSPSLGANAYIGAQTLSGVRRLSATECERLQGFPDRWTAVSAGRNQADSARYKQMGNAVAVPVVEWIARRIARQGEA